MIPGEIISAPGELTLNEDRDTCTVEVVNSGDRPVQVGSHYHFAEANPALHAEDRIRRVPSPRAVIGSPACTAGLTLGD